MTNTTVVIAFKGLIRVEYGKLLSHSAGLVWRNKTIWLFGVFLSLSSGAGNLVNYTADERDIERVQERIDSFAGSLTGETLIMLLAGLVAFIVFSIVVYLIVTGALIGLVGDAAAGKRARFGRGLGVGIRKAIPILGAALLLWIPFMIILTIVAIADIYLFIAVTRSTSDVSIPTIVILVFATALAILIFIASGIAIATIGRFANRFIVIDGKRAFAAVRRASVLFRRELGSAILTWLIMFGLTVAFIAFAGGLVAVVILAVKALFGTSLVVALSVAAALFLAALIPYGFFEAFGSTFWTLAFLALRERISDNLGTDETASPASDNGP
ncbi:MAG: hypothetical protein Q8J63_09500 [Candidatus Aquicultor sp.]|nr:hypothetical protein [Candidatus Aquicultor sp.]